MRRLKVSEAEKYKNDNEWFKDIMNQHVPFDSTVTNQYTELKRNYDLINANVKGFQEELNAFCNPFINEPDFDTNKTITHYNRIYSKFLYVVGEMKKRVDNIYVTILNQDSIERKNMQYEAALKEAIAQELFQGVQSAVEQFLSTEFKDSAEIIANSLARHAHYKFNLLQKKESTFKDVIAADQCYVYVGFQNGEIQIEEVNPLHLTYHKAPDLEDISKGDYVARRKAVTLAELLNCYDLTESELGQLYSSTSENAHDAIGGTGVPLMRDFFQYNLTQNNKNVGKYQGNLDINDLNGNQLIWVTHFEFKAFTEIYFLRYVNAIGMQETEIVPSNYKFPTNTTTTTRTNRWGRKSTFKRFEINGVIYEAEQLWIPRRHEITRIGNNIYKDAREVPFQPLDIENPFATFELSYKGRMFTNTNSDSISLVGRAKPLQFQYDLVKNLQNEQLAHFDGSILNIDVAQIPDALTYDENGKPMKGVSKVVIAQQLQRKFKRNYFDSSQHSNGIPNPQRGTPAFATNSNQLADIINLSNLLTFIDREIGLSMGVPVQSEGQISAYSNASDNERAVQQGLTMMESYYTAHSDIWRKVLQEYINQMKEYYLDYFNENPFEQEITLSYVLPNKTPAFFKITPANLSFESIGLFATNDGKDAEYRNIMLQQVFNFAQNQGQGMEQISNLILAITQGESPESVHKKLMAATREQEERIAAMQAQVALASQPDKDGVPSEKEAELIDAQIRKLDNDTRLKEREINESGQSN